MRVTPEQTRNLRVHFCLASWIAGGSRAASFVGETFPFPPAIPETWAQVHLERLRAQVGPYPETMVSTLERVGPRSAPRPSHPGRPVRNSSQSPGRDIATAHPAPGTRPAWEGTAAIIPRLLGAD